MNGTDERASKSHKFTTLEAVSVERFENQQNLDEQNFRLDERNYGSFVEQNEFQEFGNVECEAGNRTNRVQDVPNSIEIA